MQCFWSENLGLSGILKGIRVALGRQAVLTSPTKKRRFFVKKWFPFGRGTFEFGRDTGSGDGFTATKSGINGGERNLK